MDDLISRQDTIDRINEYIEEYSEIDSDGNHSEKWCAMQEAKMTIENMPSAQPEYEELTPEEAASEIASGSTMSAWYWLDDMTRLKQMGYVICRKKG